MAMDPELRTYLEAMRTETQQQMGTLDAKMGTLDAKMEALDAKMEALDVRMEALDVRIEEVRREAGVMMEAIVHEIRTLPEGLSTFQRQEADRLDAAREEAMLSRHVLPLEASAANHEKRIRAVEQGR